MSSACEQHWKYIDYLRAHNMPYFFSTEEAKPLDYTRYAYECTQAIKIFNYVKSDILFALEEVLRTSNDAGNCPIVSICPTKTVLEKQIHSFQPSSYVRR
jgi:hypothetical protein